MENKGSLPETSAETPKEFQKQLERRLLVLIAEADLAKSNTLNTPEVRDAADTIYTLLSSYRVDIQDSSETELQNILLELVKLEERLNGLDRKNHADVYKELPQSLQNYANKVKALEAALRAKGVPVEAGGVTTLGGRFQQTHKRLLDSYQNIKARVDKGRPVSEQAREIEHLNFRLSEASAQLDQMLEGHKK